MNRNHHTGTYPTMITPYRNDGSVDWEAVDALTEWYWRAGCDGIFASCQSSEIWFLGEDDRVGLARAVKKKADALAAADPSREPMTVVASGHVSDSFDDQVRELTRMAETGVDAVILITNRLDRANTSDAQWIREAEALVAALPEEVPLGLYECPHPYKRLLTPDLLSWCVSTGRFRFIKDTCCDAEEIERRLIQLRGTGLLLFNANAQTLLPSLEAGAAGYCGVMANFHPGLYRWLTHHWAENSEAAQEVADFLSLAAFTESLAYPVTAKYYHGAHGVPMNLLSRSRDPAALTPYHKMCVEQMSRAAQRLAEKLGL